MNRAPNPRMQRTPSAPLMRNPLGRRESQAAVSAPHRLPRQSDAAAHRPGFGGE